MAMLNLDALDGARLETDPFNFLVAPGFIKPEALEAINEDFPAIDGPRNYRLDELEYGGAFRAFIDELKGEPFERKIAEKFGVDIRGKPKMITVRGFCEASDGNIHTDSRTKLITVLVYFNRAWPHEGGQLRLLRSANDIEDYAAEVRPENGNLLAFRRCDHSYHGHKPYAGERRILQLSWVEEKRLGNYKDKRRKLVWRIKRMFGISSGGRLRTN